MGNWRKLLLLVAKPYAVSPPFLNSSIVLMLFLLVGAANWKCNKTSEVASPVLKFLRIINCSLVPSCSELYRTIWQSNWHLQFLQGGVRLFISRPYCVCWSLVVCSSRIILAKLSDCAKCLIHLFSKQPSAQIS